jgi:hypothetical protein
MMKGGHALFFQFCAIATPLFYGGTSAITITLFSKMFIRKLNPSSRYIIAQCEANPELL